MPKPAPHAHQVKVRNTSTGEVFSAWPVDARELVRLPANQYEYAPNDQPVTAPEPEAPVEKPVGSFLESRLKTRAALEAKSYKDLQALAKKAGVDPKQKGPSLIDAIIPHVEGGAVSLDVVPDLSLPNAQFPGAVVEE
jgi:hypothetical protein